MLTSGPAATFDFPPLSSIAAIQALHSRRFGSTQSRVDAFKAGFADPVLMTATDGVGTKLVIAIKIGR
jgi:phosphoribosylaminoimidazole (AIR) synthetase